MLFFSLFLLNYLRLIAVFCHFHFFFNNSINSNSFYLLWWNLFFTAKCLLGPSSCLLHYLASPFWNLFNDMILFLELFYFISYPFSSIYQAISNILANFKTTIQNIFEWLWWFLINKRSNDLLNALIFTSIVDLVSWKATNRKEEDDDNPEATLLDRNSFFRLILNKERITIW